VDRLISRLAGQQHGVVARSQLLAAGITEGQIDLRLRTGRLHQVHEGVYLVGHEVRPPLATEQAALLACGEGAVLSHRSAANLWGLCSYPAAAAACVIVPPARNATRPRITVHRMALERRDIRKREGLAVTSPPRTILDLALELDLEQLELLTADARYRGLASEVELKGQLARNPGKRGNAKLRRVLDLPGGPRRTRSTPERLMLRLLRDRNITGYETNARIHGHEVDVLWRELNFAVEIDGYDGHSGRVAFERDRLKVAKLKAHGLDVMPVTPRQLRVDPDGAFDRLERALRCAGYGAAPRRD
jgi:very-short-patch-repair endonuclease